MHCFEWLRRAECFLCMLPLYAYSQALHCGHLCFSLFRYRLHLVYLVLDLQGFYIGHPTADILTKFVVFFLFLILYILCLRILLKQLDDIRYIHYLYLYAIDPIGQLSYYFSQLRLSAVMMFMGARWTDIFIVLVVIG